MLTSKRLKSTSDELSFANTPSNNESDLSEEEDLCYQKSLNDILEEYCSLIKSNQYPDNIPNFGKLNGAC